MKAKANLNACYAPSENIVAREIEGEVIIVPLIAGIGDMDDELYTLNEHGKAIWRLLNNKKTLKNIAEDLSREYQSLPAEVERDILGFVEELLKRKMVVECPQV